MPNLRVIFNNAADRATVSASSTAGTLVAANLLTDMKSDPWRSASVVLGNVLTQPDAFDNAAWIKAASSVTSVNGVAAPNGAMTADKLTENSAAAQHTISVSVAFTAGVCYVLQFFVKPAGRSRVKLALGATAFTGTAAGDFDLTAVTAVSTGTTAAVPVITQLANGWYLVSIRAVATASATTTAALLLHNGTSDTYTGDGTSGAYLAAADLRPVAAASITATWTTLEAIGGVALPYCNLLSGATIRMRGYTNTADAIPAFDTGEVSACPYPAPGLWNWGSTPLGANAYTYGGGTVARSWLALQASVKKVVLDIVDLSGTDGYIEASRLVLGGYWEPAKNADYGASAQPVDTGKNYRNDAGDLMSEPGTRHTKVSFSMSKMDTADRAQLWDILRGNGITRPLFLSLFPDHTDVLLEQTHQVYGKLVDTPATSLPSYNVYAASSIAVEGV